MLAACRLAGLSALILDYGVTGVRAQLPKADRTPPVWRLSRIARRRCFRLVRDRLETPHSRSRFSAPALRNTAGRLSTVSGRL
jgi:hypothetical protein